MSEQAWPVDALAATHRTSRLRRAWQHAKDGAERPAHSNSECPAWSQGASHECATGRPTETLKQRNTCVHGRGLLSRLNNFKNCHEAFTVVKIDKRQFGNLDILAVVGVHAKVPVASTAS